MIVVILLTGCTPPEQKVIPDQCLRSKLFRECMQVLPAGPNSTRYNDWDEVVQACSNEAYYSSLRKRSTIKEECQL